MSLTLLVHDNRTQRRSSFLARPDATTPIPPSLVNSPYLSSPNSVFRRKTSVLRWPSQEEDEWLRDMVPIDKSSSQSDADARSEGSSDAVTPSPTTSDSSYGCLLFPPSSRSPIVTSAKPTLPGSPSSGQPSHN